MSKWQKVAEDTFVLEVNGAGCLVRYTQCMGDGSDTAMTWIPGVVQSNFRGSNPAPRDACYVEGCAGPVGDARPYCDEHGAQRQPRA